MSKLPRGNPLIGDFAAMARRRWLNLCAGPLKWIILGAVLALTGVLTCVPARP